MDKEVVSLVNYFNKNGLSTYMSCQGHNSTNMSMFWISFTKNVTEQDIINFQKKHRDSFGNFTSCGRFAERLYVGKESIEKEWCYLAATIQAANADLSKWINQDIT